MDIGLLPPSQEKPMPSSHQETTPSKEENETAMLIEDLPLAIVAETRKLLFHCTHFILTEYIF